MKRAALFFTLLPALLLVSSCEKKITELIKNNAGQAGLSAVDSDLVADEKSAFCVLADLPVWDIVEGKTKWKDNLQIGEKVGLGESTAKALQSGTEREFIQVRRDSGKEGWARTDYLVSKAMLGVVTSEEVILYTQPKNTAATGKALKRMTVLAIHRESAAQAFLRITAVDENQVLQKEIFVRNEGISASTADVQSAILLQIASKAKNPKQKEALLRSAVSDYPGSAFRVQIDGALAELAAASAKATEKFIATLLVNDDNVNVRVEPDENSGAVVAKLGRDQRVEVEEKTVESYMVGTATAPWYRIREPAGWVFGAFLQTEE